MRFSRTALRQIKTSASNQLYHSIQPGQLSCHPRAKLLSSSPQHLSKRSISQEKQQAYVNYFNPPKRNWARILLTTASVLGVAGYIGWYFFWPHHTFSKEVAKTLRKALWAESDKEDFNHKKALKLYIEALQIAEQQQLDRLSDEYTGIQIKIAEMYEKLGLIKEASSIYHEISDVYLAALNSESFPIECRPHIIQKDLRVIVKYAHLNPDKGDYLKNYLFVHLLKAEEEVLSRLGESIEASDNDETEHVSFVGSKLTLMSLYKATGMPSVSLENERVLRKLSQLTEKPKEIKLKFYKDNAIFEVPGMDFSWMPFREEFFNARDLFVSLCLLLGDRRLAIHFQHESTLWMQASGCSIFDILNSYASCGSLFYLTAEEHESYEINARRSQNESLANSEAHQKALFVQGAILYYRLIQNIVKLLPPWFVRDHEDITKSVALATYSLGVIDLHYGNLIEAEKQLREARLRAKSVAFDDLVLESENELKKLRKEEAFKKNAKTQTKELENIEMTYLMTKKE